MHSGAPALTIILFVSQSYYLIQKHLLRAIYGPGSVMRIFPSNDSFNPYDNIVNLVQDLSHIQQMAIKALIIRQVLGQPDERYIYFWPSRSPLSVKRHRPVNNTIKI